MGQKQSKRRLLTLHDRIMLLFFIDHALDELDRDMRDTDAMFKRLVDGLQKVNVTGRGPKDVRRPRVQRRRGVQNLSVRSAMEDLASLDLAE